MSRRYFDESAFAWMARIGYAARGLVFLLIAGFALITAFSGDNPKGTRGVLESILGQPLGGFLLIAIAAGLTCFAVWRVVEAIFDVDQYSLQPHALIRRAGLVGGGLVSLAIAGLAISIFFGLRAEEDDVVRDWTAWLLSQPFGRWATVIVGLAIAGSGFAQVIKPAHVTFRTELVTRPGPHLFVITVGIIGFVGRAVVLAIVGVFLVIAALRFNAGDAAGLAGALKALQAQTFGSYLLGIIAFGLFSFGVFQCTEAIWRRIDVPQLKEIIEKPSQL